MKAGFSQAYRESQAACLVQRQIRQGNGSADFWRTDGVSKTIKVALAGAGAFGTKHLDGIKNIDGVEVVSLVGRRLDATKEIAAKYGIAHVSTELADSLKIADVDAVILCTPTQMHAEQTIAC